MKMCFHRRKDPVNTHEKTQKGHRMEMHEVFFFWYLHPARSKHCYRFTWQFILFFLQGLTYFVSHCAYGERMSRYVIMLRRSFQEYEFATHSANLFNLIIIQKYRVIFELNRNARGKNDNIGIISTQKQTYIASTQRTLDRRDQARAAHKLALWNQVWASAKRFSHSTSWMLRHWNRLDLVKYIMSHSKF